MRSYAAQMGACLRKALWTDRQGFSASSIVTDALKNELKERGYIVMRQFLTESEAAALPAYCDFVSALKAGSSSPGMKLQAVQLAVK